MFRLRRYFSIASLLAFVLVTVLLGMLYRSVALRMFVQLEENKNVELTQSFANSLWPELQPLIASSESSTHVVLRDIPVIAELRQAVITQMRGLSVVKVKVYDLDGHTIFSTQIDQIGDDDSDNAGYQGARLGQVASELTHRDTFSAFEETIEDQDVLSTYIPIYENGPNSPVVGVFELYSNVTPFLLQINRTQLQLIIGVSLTLALLYGALLLIVSRADSILRRQHQEQLAFSEEIRRQQREVTLLQEREHVAREIHDSLGQILGYVNTQAQAARSLLGKQKIEAADTLLKRLVVVAQDAHVELRDFILNLQTGDVNEQSFLPRLRNHLEQFRQSNDIQTELYVSAEFGKLTLPTAVGVQLFRIVQEALNNVRKHAAAKHVHIQATSAGDGIQLLIEDDGQGFDDTRTVTNRQGPNNHGHWGLQNMYTRAAEIGATVQISSVIGTGTKIIVQLPHPQQPMVNPQPLLQATSYLTNRAVNSPHMFAWLWQPFSRIVAKS